MRESFRFIPAPAGNASAVTPRAVRLTVHPRACGERGDLAELIAIRRGSSPRLRGTPGRRGGAVTPPRFIPAPAGNARFVVDTAGDRPVHPRACGERPLINALAPARHGSSPRLRGTLTRSPGRPSAGRFIPAPAGNARAHCRQCGPISVHPRACGERMRMRDSRSASAGSSPRLRGTRGEGNRLHRDRRFIPAPAGNAKTVRRS